MMQKILVDVEVPSIQKDYEVNIPDDLCIGKVIELLSMMVEEQSGGTFTSSDNEILCIRNRNLIMSRDCSLVDYGVLNGDHLVLM